MFSTLEDQTELQALGFCPSHALLFLNLHTHEEKHHVYLSCILNLLCSSKTQPNVLYILDNTTHKDLFMFATFLHFDHISTSS